MITLDTALKILAHRVEPLAPHAVAATTALGCRLAEPIVAQSDWPSADVSTMDGYTARASDVAAGKPLPQAFEVPAGALPEPLPPGRCARIFTGAPLPAGADVVAPQEEVDIVDQAVRMPSCGAGRFIRRRGEVLQAGDALADANAPVTPQLLALLIAVGPPSVRVYPRPRVGVVSTGMELLPPDAPLAAGRIRDSNGPMVAALASVSGCAVTALERVGDDLGAIERAISTHAASCDLLLTSGGVSVGDYDLVPEVLRRLSADLLFHKVSIRPGKPVLAARLGDTWVLGLPGNPVSAFVGWHLFGRSIAGRLAGAADPFDLPTVPATLEDGVANVDKRLVVCPANLHQRDDAWHVRPLRWKGSHDVLAIARAEAFVFVEGGVEYAAGARVDCMPLRLAT